MLQVVNLVKKFDKYTAVNNLNMEIEDGSIFGFVGPNGAGKTTTLKIISGLMQATSGKVLVNGVDIIGMPRHQRDKIGYMPDFFGVYDNLKVNEYMDFYAGMYYIPFRERKDIVMNLLELVGLTDKYGTYVDNLSRGMKQRLCLARCLINDPEVCILDEPASGLDPRARFEMCEILKQLSGLGKTIIISSHILPELAELCTTVGIINNGTMAASGTVAEIMRSLTKARIIHIKPLEKMNELIILLKQSPEVHEIFERESEAEFVYDGDNQSLSGLLREIVLKGVPVAAFYQKDNSLEDIFLQLTERNDSNA